MTKRLIVIGALLALVPQLVQAESLYDAIALAYQTNPTLRAQRAELRAIDEEYVQAKAGYGPQVNVNAQVGYQDARVQQGASLLSNATATDYRAGTGSADVSAVQPVYSGGAIAAQVRGATADILAAREALRQAESQMVFNVVTAYVDVRRDRETVRILKDEIAALTKDFEETRAKGVLGALSKTDVAQSQARLLSAQAQLNLAHGRLNASNAEYLNVVGQSPGELAPEPDLAGLPKTIDEAFAAAEHNNAQLLQAIQTERAAREKANQAKAANGANVSVKVDAAVQPTEPYFQRLYDRSITVAAVVNMPLFTSGLNRSKVRQALEEDNRAQIQIDAARRGVVQAVAQAWDQLVSTRNAMAIENQQVEVERVAAGGNRVEERVGLRTTIDLLNAELELANARIGLIQDRHDEYIARATLLAAMGLLEVRYQVPGLPIYQPRQSYERVKSLGALPWEGAIAAVDGVGSASTRPSRVLPDAEAHHPADTPALPAAMP